MMATRNVQMNELQYAAMLGWLKNRVTDREATHRSRDLSRAVKAQSPYAIVSNMAALGRWHDERLALKALLTQECPAYVSALDAVIPAIEKHQYMPGAWLRQRIADHMAKVAA